MPPRSDRVERVSDEMEDLVELAVVVGVSRRAVDARKSGEVGLSRVERSARVLGESWLKTSSPPSVVTAHLHEVASLVITLPDECLLQAAVAV